MTSCRRHGKGNGTSVALEDSGDEEEIDDSLLWPLSESDDDEGMQRIGDPRR